MTPVKEDTGRSAHLKLKEIYYYKEPRHENNN